MWNVLAYLKVHHQPDQRARTGPGNSRSGWKKRRYKLIFHATPAKCTKKNVDAHKLALSHVVGS